MSHSRLTIAFGLLIAAQSAHSIEEYLGRLWDVFPPAAFVSGLIASNREVGFVILNVALVTFGIWCLVWPIARAWPSAAALVSFWCVLEGLNGVGHILWSLLQRGYVPGLVTAPLLLIFTFNLTRVDAARINAARHGRRRAAS